MYRETIDYNITDTPIFVSFENQDNDRTITFDWHFHKEIEMTYLKTSSKKVYANNKLYNLSPGDIIFINGQIPHKTVSYNKAEFILLQFCPKREKTDEMFPLASFFVRQAENGVVVIKNGTKLNEILKKIMLRIENEFQKKDFCFDKFIDAYIGQIVACLYREKILAEGNEKPFADTASMQKIIPVIKYINSHFSEQLTLSRLSEIISVDKAHLCRVFKALTKSTLSEYINFVRVIYAEQLLLNTDKLILEICEETGFSSVSYFAKVFKEKNGITPKKYRSIKNN